MGESPCRAVRHDLAYADRASSATGSARSRSRRHHRRSPPATLLRDVSRVNGSWACACRASCARGCARPA